MEHVNTEQQHEGLVALIRDAAVRSEDGVR
jgi:hypothetical protein